MTFWQRLRHELGWLLCIGWDKQSHRWEKYPPFKPGICIVTYKHRRTGEIRERIHTPLD